MEKTIITACSLSSSSSGNSIYITDGATSVLIDAGISARRTAELLMPVGGNIAKIDAIFVTHEHIDHVKGLPALCAKYKTPVYMAKRSFDSLPGAARDGISSYVNFIAADSATKIGGLEVRSFKTPHDSAESVGYAVYKNSKKAAAVATDIGTVSDNVREGLRGAEILFIESNHDLDLLHNNRNYSEYLKARIRSKVGHLSNLDCAEAVPFFIANGARKVMLYHLSSENNKRELAFNAAKISIIDAKLNVGKVFLGVAPKDEPSVVMMAEASAAFAEKEASL